MRKVGHWSVLGGGGVVEGGRGLSFSLGIQLLKKMLGNYIHSREKNKLGREEEVLVVYRTKEKIKRI